MKKYIITIENEVYAHFARGGDKMNSRTKSIDMCSGPLAGKILAFTIPVILSGVLQLLFNAMDMVVVGRFAGSISLAAVGSTSSLTNLLVNFFIGFSISSGIVISHAIGAKRKRDIHEIVHTSAVASVVSGILVGIIGFVFSPLILGAMGSPENVIGKSVTYLRIIFLGMPANMVYNFGASMLRATGETKKPLYYLTIAGIINVVLNLLFVIVFRMDVAGVALATIISQTVSAVLVVRELMRGNEYFRLQLKEIKIYKDKLSKIITIGLPSGIQSSLFSISNVLIQSSINSFGAVAIAGNSAGSNIEGFVYVVMNSFYQAAITFAGQNMGAKKYSRITKTALISIAFASGLGFLLGQGVYIFGRELLGIYIPEDLVSIEFGLKRLQIIGTTYFFCGIMEVMTGILRGMGYSLISMIVSLFGACFLRVIWIYTVFAKIHTLKCLYISYPVSWILVACVDILIYYILMKKIRKREINAL